MEPSCESAHNSIRRGCDKQFVKKGSLLGHEIQESSGSSDENHPIVACRNDRVMVGEKESGLAFAEVASQFAPCGIELILVIAEVHSVAVDLFQVTPDFLAIF